MRQWHRIAAVSTVGLLLLAGARSSPDVERLSDLPLAERQRLARRLAEFEALPEAEQARVRALDRQLQALDPEERRHVEDLLQSFDRWLGGLPRSVRATIQASPPEDRLALIEKARDRQIRERPRQAQRARAFDDRLQVSDLGAESLLLSALQLRAWFGQAAASRVDGLKSASALRQREALLKAALDSGEVVRLERDLSLSLGSPRRIVRHEGILAEVVRQRLRRATIPNRADHRLRRLELGYLRSVAESPINPDQIAAFRAELPPWIRDSLDLFPATTAERRVRLLYQLVFPGSEEAPSVPEPIPARTP